MSDQTKPDFVGFVTRFESNERPFISVKLRGKDLEVLVERFKNSPTGEYEGDDEINMIIGVKKDDPEKYYAFVEKPAEKKEKEKPNYRLL
jgi:hypothetical protein